MKTAHRLERARGLPIAGSARPPFRRYIAALLASALLATIVMGCASTREGVSLSAIPRTIAEVQAAPLPPHGTPISTQTAAHPTSDSSRPTIALVLGGGGLRGFAHVGVLSALEELGVHPDIIVGTSAGAVVGAAYASGMTPDELRAAALSVRVSSLIDLTLSSSGLMRGNNLANWIDGVTGNQRIENFPRRFAAVATDLESGRAVLLDTGPAGSVVLASSAVPGANVPVAYDKGHLVDGGVASLIPVRFARAMGADVVIAVDIYCQSPRANGLSVPSIIGRVMHTQSCLLADAEIAEADVVIAPTVHVPGMSSKEAQERVIQAGYEAAHAALRNWSGEFAVESARTTRTARAQPGARVAAIAPSRWAASGVTCRANLPDGPTGDALAGDAATVNPIVFNESALSANTVPPCILATSLRPVRRSAAC